MPTLALKVPPLLVLALVAVLMALIDAAWPAGRLHAAGSQLLAWAAGAALVAGAVVAGMGVWAFRRARTTVDPRHPEQTRGIVDTGIYRHSRNPMYLGFALALLALALWLANPLAAVGVPLFVAYLNRWQIGPEELVLRARFGAPYLAYCSRVRRWV